MFSQEFSTALEAIYGFPEFANGLFIIAGLLSIASIFLRIRLRYRFILILLISILSFVIASTVFNQRWANLNHQARTENDKEWLAAHDGGLLVVGAAILFKTFLVFVTGTVSIMIARVRERRISAQSSETKEKNV